MSRLLSIPLALTALSALALAQEPVRCDAETYRLDNGTTVTLHVDHSLPKVLINTWFAVGSKDERPGRSGFAHLFEHLMFMGTERVPGAQFDVLMEAGGGRNNASTSKDRTNYYSLGPSSLLPTLLWLDADRLDGLADAMTQEKLDAQREVVRNERRQTTENQPYGMASLELARMMYPVEHPYHHSVIGSHEDLQAATVQDVVDFFHEYYVPSNASLVVAGDFDPEVVKPLIESTFGAVPAAPLPEHRDAEPVRLEREVRSVLTDSVQFPRLYLAWHSPAYYAPGDAQMDLAGSILTGGPSSRLEKRLVLDTQLAQSVFAYQASGELGSTFQIVATARDGVDLDALKREILDVVETLKAEGPTADELARVQVQMETSFRRRMEDLGDRADSMNAYLRYFGTADGFQRDLDRWTKATPEDVRDWCRTVMGDGRADLRVLPESMEVASPLDVRPADFAPEPVELFTPHEFALSNGIRVIAIPRAGSRLFSGSLLARGGEALVEPERAGLSALLARVMDSGAGGLDAAAFADAVESLGASIGTGSGTEWMTVSVSGLSGQLEPTLDRFAQVILEPNLAPADFEREKALTLAAIEARTDDPQSVGRLLTDRATYGADDPRGRPTNGELDTVGAADLDALRAAHAELLHPARASFVFVGDFALDALQSALERRFGSWSVARAARPAAELAPLVEPAPGRILLFDRPGAPQTVIRVSRPVPPADGVARAARECVDTVLGGSFTSRLNSNLRERNGYTYGAGSRMTQSGAQFSFLASTAVRTNVTGAALAEIRSELAALAESGIDAQELGKAVATRRMRLVESAETTSGLQRALSGLVQDGRPTTAFSADLNDLARVTLEQANAAAASGLFAWDDLLVVLVGDKEAVLPQLEELGFPEPELVALP